MSLFLKYRPQTFEDVVEQKHIIDILAAQIQKGEFNNNYLLFWPRWTWKTTTARLLAKAANCLQPINGSPCNECRNCLSISKWQTLDFVEIDAASHTQVDNIREEIIEKAPYPPSMLKKKIYIIDEVHMLSKAAFNALLKIMEEPPVYLMFILATTEINKVPETIISRCQVFNFKKLSENHIVWRLKYISDKEWFEYEDEALHLIAKVSDWAMRDWVKYLEQVSILWKIDQTNVSKFLWVAPERTIVDFISFIKDKDLNWTLLYIDQLQTNWIDLYVFAKEVLMYIDSHLMDDLDFYVSLSDVFKDIIIWIKNYPYPPIIYKVSLYKMFNWNVSAINRPNPTSNSSNINESKVVSNTDSPKQNQTVGSNEEKSTQSTLLSWDDMITKVIDLTDKITVKWALRRYVSFESYNDWVISLNVINQMQYNILMKEIWLLQDLFSKVTWNSQVKLNLHYVSKEDFLQKQFDI